MATLSFVNGHPKRALAAFLELPCHVGTCQDAGEEHRLARLIRYEDERRAYTLALKTSSSVGAKTKVVMRV